jgi:RNA polymerase sigma-70 factor, ECF subfamily
MYSIYVRDFFYVFSLALVIFCDFPCNTCMNSMEDFEKLSDQELIYITLHDDTLAFDEIVRRYQAPILRYTMRLLNFNQSDSEDVTSEAMFKAYRNLASYKPEFKFSTWLYRIAHNEAVNLIKKNSKFFTMDLEGFMQIASPQKDEPEVEISSDQLEKALDQLKIDDKNLLILFYLEEKSLREIGDILNLTDNTVAQKLSRARKRAKKIITNT